MCEDEVSETRKLRGRGPQWREEAQKERHYTYTQRGQLIHTYTHTCMDRWTRIYTHVICT